MDEPELAPTQRDTQKESDSISLTRLRRVASTDDRDGVTTMGLRSWRSLREELGGTVHPARQGTSPVGKARVTVPTNLAVVLRGTLAGPQRRCGRVIGCVPLVWRVRAWCATWAIIGFCSGYTSLIFKDGTFVAAPPQWSVVGYCAVWTYASVGVICAIATYEMSEIVGATTDDNEQVVGRRNLDAGLLLGSSDGRDEQELRGATPERDAELGHHDDAELGHHSPLRENPSSSFLRGLLQCEVSTAASQVLAQQVKRAQQAGVFVSVVVAIQALLNLTRPGRREHLDGTVGIHVGLLLSVVVFWAVFFPCMVMVIGWLIFLRAPCIITCDRIKYSAARVRMMTSETADYDAIMGYIHEAHELTVRLGVLLSPTLLGTTARDTCLYLATHLTVIRSSDFLGVAGTCFMCTMVTLQWCLAACTILFCETHQVDGWVDRATGHALVSHMPVQMFLSAAFVVVQGPVPTPLKVWQMFAGASTTTACEELVEAVAALRHSRKTPTALSARETAAAGATAAAAPRLAKDEAMAIASPDNLIRIQGLLRFAQDVNRGAGLGLQLKLCRPLYGRRPITVSFVWRLVFTVAGVMLSLLAIVLVLIRYVQVK